MPTRAFVHCNFNMHERMMIASICMIFSLNEYRRSVFEVYHETETNHLRERSQYEPHRVPHISKSIEKQNMDVEQHKERHQDAVESASATAPPRPPPLAQPSVVGVDEVLSLPPPPSHPDMDDDSLRSKNDRTTVDDAHSTPTSSGTASTAAKASSAAFSLAAAAKSRLAQGGRMMLSPLVQTGSSTSRSNSEKTASFSSGTAASAPANPSSVPHSSAASLPTASSIGYGIASLPGAAASSFGSLLFSSPGSVANSTTASTASPNSAVDGSESAAAKEAAAVAAAVAAEEFRQVSAQQRMQILEDLVQSRRSDWSYLKAMHEGTNYWLNIALLREQQVLTHLGEKQTIRRSVQFFYLGLGLGRLISEFNHSQFLAMEGCQLLEELEFYFSSATVQGMVSCAKMRIVNAEMLSSLVVKCRN